MKNKLAQQYLLPISEEMLENKDVLLGGFVLHGDDDDTITGFISDFDESYVEFTLFEPIKLSELPKETIVLKETMTNEEWAAELKRVERSISDFMRDKWKEVLLQKK